MLDPLLDPVAAICRALGASLYTGGAAGCTLHRVEPWPILNIQDGLLCRVGQETSFHSFYTPKENFRVTLTLVGVTLGWVSLYIYGLMASLFHYFYKELIKDPFTLLQIMN